MFLMDRYDIAQFNVASEYCHSRYMNVLQRLLESYPNRKIQITAITRYPDMPKEEWEHAASRFIPPCDTVQNIDPHTRNVYAKILRMTKAMMDQSDFCICSLSQDTFSDSIKKYMSKVKGTKVFDLSKQQAAPFTGCSYDQQYAGTE